MNPDRGQTYNEQNEQDQTGTPCRVHSYAHRGDKARMVEDIKKAKEQAEIVGVSRHWGIHFTDAEIAQYQYVLKAPIPTADEQAECYAYYPLETTFETYDKEAITVIGVVEASKYMKCDVKTGEIYITDVFAEKYRWKVGDLLTLKECNSADRYSFT